MQITKDEELSKAICNGCYDLLIKLSEFKKTCIQSHKTLLKYNVKSEKVEILIESLLPSNNCKSNKDWSHEKTQNLFSNEDSYIDNIVKEEEFEDHYGNGK